MVAAAAVTTASKILPRSVIIIPQISRRDRRPARTVFNSTIRAAVSLFASGFSVAPPNVRSVRSGHGRRLPAVERAAVRPAGRRPALAAEDAGGVGAGAPRAPAHVGIAAAAAGRRAGGGQGAAVRSLRGRLRRLLGQP